MNLIGRPLSLLTSSRKPIAVASQYPCHVKTLDLSPTHFQSPYSPELTLLVEICLRRLVALIAHASQHRQSHPALLTAHRGDGSNPSMIVVGGGVVAVQSGLRGGSLLELGVRWWTAGGDVHAGGTGGEVHCSRLVGRVLAVGADGVDGEGVEGNCEEGDEGAG
jgi:hypothetical protein